MAHKFIVEDSSFVVSLLNSNDSCHPIALKIFKIILSQTGKVKVVIPTPVIYETLFALIRNKIDRHIVEQKLWNMLMIEDILNYPLLETSALRLAKKTYSLINQLPPDSILPANDLMILTVALDFPDSCILTFDNGMKKFASICPNLFCLLDDNGEKNFSNFLKS